MSRAASIHLLAQALEMPGMRDGEVAQPKLGMFCLPCGDMGICRQVSRAPREATQRLAAGHAP